MRLDHILWAVPELESGVAQLADLLGVTPSEGGSHPGFGTRNQLLSLGDRLFFEVIAPDPEQTKLGQRADAIATLSAPELHTFCMESTDLDTLAARAQEAGIRCSEPVGMSRTRADGVTLAWRILYFEVPDFGPAIPFVIDWQGSEHPASTSPEGCGLVDFAVLHPRAEALSGVYAALGIDVPVRAASRPGFLTRLTAPKGEVTIL